MLLKKDNRGTLHRAFFCTVLDQWARRRLPLSLPISSLLQVSLVHCLFHSTSFRLGPSLGVRAIAGSCLFTFRVSHPISRVPFETQQFRVLYRLPLFPYLCVVHWVRITLPSRFLHLFLVCWVIPPVLLILRLAFLRCLMAALHFIWWQRHQSKIRFSCSDKAL